MTELQFYALWYAALASNPMETTQQTTMVGFSIACLLVHCTLQARRSWKAASHG